MSTHYYILSGLGADHRVFSKIKFPKNHTHLPWLENKPHESLTQYAGRMAEGITNPNPTIIGLSFGGIVAQEIAALRHVKELILISTITSKDEKPWYMGVAGKLKLVRLIPNFVLTKPNIFVAYAFSLNTKEDRKLLQACFKNTTADHMKWAMNHISHWRGVNHHSPILRIGAKHDRIFKTYNDIGDIQVKGGHFAVYTNAREINEVLKDKFNRS